MRRARGVVVGVGLVAVLAAGLLMWWPSPSVRPCEGAVAEGWQVPDAAPLDSVVWRVELRALTEVSAPFGPQRVAVPHPWSPQLTGDGVLVQHSLEEIAALDARTGKELWGFKQHGTSLGATHAGADTVLVQQRSGELTAVGVDRRSGKTSSCTTFPERTAELTHGITVATANRDIAVLRRTVTGKGSILSLVDPDLDKPVWTREVDLTGRFTTGYAAGDTIVFSVAGENPVSVIDLATDQIDNYSQEERRLHGFSVKNGEPRWSYLSGGASQVVGTDADHVVVRVSVLNPATNTMSNRLTVLDAREGVPLWAVDLPASSPDNYDQARLFGDVVVSTETDPTLGASLTGRDLRTGTQLWRISNRTTHLYRSALVGDTALIPGLANQGLEIIDVHTGESRTTLAGVTVRGVTADETSIGVETSVSVGALLVLYERAG
jgi:outer membrane protein assembly factor BamB